ncbi:MAG TPA: hypothetical protein ENI92_00320, partial [Bacteroidetes bacterium]|nr:hypothetical protein [Bacteroidota bacterium]
LEDCAVWSRRFEELLDLRDDLPRSYALDVTSPGVGHPLKEEWEFRKNAGRELKLTLRREGGEDGGGTETRTLRLERVEAGTLVFDDGSRIPLDAVIEAKVALPW